MFKVFGIIGISKIEFFNFSDTEKVKKILMIRMNEAFLCLAYLDQKLKFVVWKPRQRLTQAL